MLGKYKSFIVNMDANVLKNKLALKNLELFCNLDLVLCRNPNLAKCGGEAQHLEKLGIWSPPGLPNV